MQNLKIYQIKSSQEFFSLIELDFQKYFRIILIFSRIIIEISEKFNFKNNFVKYVYAFLGFDFRLLHLYKDFF